VTQVAVPETFANVVHPAFEFRGVDLYGRAAGTTGQVVVVRIVYAASIERLSPIRHHYVDHVGVGEFLELAVHGGEGHFAAVTHDEIV
jgi:hypothetical protein